MYSSSLTAKPRYAVKVEVQHAERMGVADLTEQRDRRRRIVAAFAVADGQGRPLADAVRGQNRRSPRRRGEKRGGGMGRVVRREEDLRPRHAEMRCDDAAYPYLFAERVFDRLRKRTPRARKRSKRARQDALELQHAAFVEDHRIELRRIDRRLVQTPFDRTCRKPGVVLVPRQPLFLDGAHRDAVDDKRGGRIVIVGGNAEDLHSRTDSWAIRCGRARSAPSPATRASRRGAPSTRMVEEE